MIEARTTLSKEKIANTQALKDTKTIIRQTPKHRLPGQLYPEFIVHRGSGPITYSNLQSEIDRAAMAVTEQEKKEFPYPVLIMKSEVITVKWCRDPEPPASSAGFTNPKEISITLNLLCYRRIGLDFLNQKVAQLRGNNENGRNCEVLIRPFRGPWVFKLSIA